MPGLKMRGFSLVELLTVLVIVTLLGAVAYPGYQRHLTGSHRVLAAACLLEHAQAMERYHAVNKSYLDAPDPVPCHGLSGVYDISFMEPRSTSGYTLQAIPLGAQAIHDAQCGTLLLNQWGERQVSAEGMQAGQCW